MVYGSLAQLGEHLPYKQRVIGSNPITSILSYTCMRSDRESVIAARVWWNRQTQET